jgi:hypothetical protein
MSVYEINYDIAVQQHTPVRLRKLRRLAWLRTLVAGVVSVYDMFMEARSRSNYYLAHNSQVCYMEAALNDTFDPTLRRIFIEDGPFLDPTYTYLVPEDAEFPLALDSELPGPLLYDAPIWLYTDVETSVLGVQFIVYYPGGVGFTFDMNRMKALIGKYRLPSKRNYQVLPNP